MHNQAEFQRAKSHIEINANDYEHLSYTLAEAEFVRMIKYMAIRLQSHSHAKCPVKQLETGCLKSHNWPCFIEKTHSIIFRIAGCYPDLNNSP